MKVSIDDVVATLKELKVPSETIIKVETELEAKEAESKAQRVPGAKTKNQFVVVALDPQGHIKGDVTAFVVQMPAEDDAGLVLDRMHKAAYDFNQGKKRGQPVTNIGNIGDVKRKFTKAHNIHIKTKEPVRVVVTQGPIPTS